jgi:hypothetical protein
MSGIVALLAGEETISGLVGNRISPILIPEGCTLPAVSYQVVGGSSAPTFNTSGMQKLRVQFDCHARHYKIADAVREALRSFLNGYYGLLADGTYLQNAEFLQPIDYFDNDSRQYRCGLEFYLYFTFSGGADEAMGQAFISTLQLTAPSGISAYRAAADVAGAAQLADSSDVSQVGRVLGIVTAAAVPGSLATVQFAGQVTFNGWNWDLTKPVFLGLAGALTQTAPNSGFAQVMGTPISSTTLLVEPQPPIVIA